MSLRAERFRVPDWPYTVAESVMSNVAPLRAMGADLEAATPAGENGKAARS
jgi:hypothetical protein